MTMLVMLTSWHYNENHVDIVRDTSLSGYDINNALLKLELKQLRVLQALLRERNLSRVAEQQGVSQQAISDHLRKLRLAFSDRLFVRASNGVIPTPFAERLSVKLDAVLHDLASLLTKEEFNPKEVEGVFKVSATDFEQIVILPELLNMLREQAPKLKVVVMPLELDELYQQLQSGQLDLAFTTPSLVPAQCVSKRLYQESYTCVACRHSTMIAQPNQPATPEQLAKLPQLVVSPSRGDLHGMIDSWFEEFGLTRNVVLSVPSFAVAAQCVATTDTLAFLPSRLLPDDRLRAVPLLEHPPGFDVITAWHPRSSQDNLHLWIRSLLDKIINQWGVRVVDFH